MSARPVPRPPESIAAYVEVLGVDDAIKFLLEFGGSEVWFPTGPDSTSELVEVMGVEKALAITESAPHLKARVPVAKKWLAQALAAKGLPNGRIARKLRVTDVHVRKLLAQDAGTKSSPNQLDLF
ncbi:MAG: helix-turn-helix domain-containing protein [Pseudomonadota bacterium]